jgi:hypothetical protein
MCFGGGGGGSSSTTSEASIAPELRPLFSQTAGTVGAIQNQLADQGYFSQFFPYNPQQIPGFTPGEQQLSDVQMQQAQSPYVSGTFTAPQLGALGQIQELTGGPLGSSPATQSAMAAIRTPVLNDLALAGLGNSDAVASNQAAAFAPILAEEMRMRAGLVPTEAGIGQQGYVQQQQLINQAMQSQEQQRAIQEAQGQANYADFLRQQGLGTQYSTGILGGFPAISGSTSSTKTKSGSSGTVICSELYRQELMSEEMFDADVTFGNTLPMRTLAGYRWWGEPVARLMERSKLATRIIAPITLAVAKEMCHVVSHGKGSLLGRIILRIGLPICAIIGRWLERRELCA